MCNYFTWTFTAPCCQRLVTKAVNLVTLMCLAHMKPNLDHSLYVWSAVLKDLNVRLEKGERIWMCIAASEQIERTKRNMIFKSKLWIQVANFPVDTREKRLTSLSTKHMHISYTLWNESPLVSLQKLQLGLPVVWLQTTLGARFFPEQFGAARRRNVVCLPQEPEGKAAAWTEGRPAELRWERRWEWQTSKEVRHFVTENSGLQQDMVLSGLGYDVIVAIRCQENSEKRIPVAQQQPKYISIRCDWIELNWYFETVSAGKLNIIVEWKNK